MPDYSSISAFYVDKPRTQVTKGLAYVFTLKVYSDNTQLVPTSCTISITKPGGGALATAVSGEAAAVDGSGTCTYTLTAANADELDANWKAEWKPVISSTTYHMVQLFDVVRYPLRNMVIQADLIVLHPDLTDLLLGAASDFQSFIERAFEDVYMFVDAKRKRPWLHLDSEELRRPVEHRALELIYNSVRKNDDDRYSALMNYHRDELHKWLSSTNFAYDADDSGDIDGTTTTGAQAGEEGRGSGVRWRT